MWEPISIKFFQNARLLQGEIWFGKLFEGMTQVQDDHPFGYQKGAVIF